jgi:RNA polymerase sigma-70 factor, ECF subfamily
VKAYQSIGSFDDGAAFAPWIHRIVTNLALDTLKKRKRYPEEELQGSEPAARRDSASLPAQSNELASRIDAAIERLPGMQRVVARLFLVEHFDHAAIAAMTGLTEGTIRSHLSLARGKLKDELQDLYGGNDE